MTVVIKNSTTHALSCKVGGLIHSRHDESRDSLGCLAYTRFKPSNVRDEPQIIACRDIGNKDEVTNWSNPIQELNTKSTLIEGIYWFVAVAIWILIVSSIFALLMAISLLILLANLPVPPNLQRMQKGKYLETYLEQRRLKSCLERKPISFWKDNRKIDQ